MLIKNLSTPPAVFNDRPWLTLDKEFTDMSEYGKHIGWDLDFRQLDPGGLRARAALMISPGMAGMRVELNRKFHQSGSPPAGLWTFGIPDVACGEFQWCGSVARGGDVLNFNGHSGFEGVSTVDFAGYTLSFTDDFLNSVARILGLDNEWTEKVYACSVWSGVESFTAALRIQLAALLLAEHPHRRQTAMLENQQIQFQAAALILSVLSRQLGWPADSKLSVRRLAARRAVELMEDAERIPGSITKLCERLGVSSPTLYRGFIEEYGVSPKKYLQIRRLTGAKLDLASSGPGVKVHEVANRWDFWHMGQFSGDYRRQFGELPSETLARFT